MIKSVNLLWTIQLPSRCLVFPRRKGSPKTEIQSKNLKVTHFFSSSSAFYNLPSVNSNRSTSLGRGEKYDFTRNGRGKNPQFYNLPSDFDPKKPHTPSWSFGISRSYYEKVYYESSKFVDKNNPGPGKYNHIKPFGSDAFKFSMFGKGNSKTFSQTAKCPGPGEYPIVSINTKGKYPLSNMKNATTIVFGLSKEKRFTYSCKLDHI